MTGEAAFPPAFQTSAHDTRSEYRSNAVGEDEGANLVMSDDASAQQLSPRELAILRCLINGNSNSASRERSTAEGTGKVHVKTVLRKIRVRVSRNREHRFHQIMSTDFRAS
jgi:two-component system nitrate/nitrite response regulator NarL